MRLRDRIQRLPLWGKWAVGAIAVVLVLAVIGSFIPEEKQTSGSETAAEERTAAAQQEPPTTTKRRAPATTTASPPANKKAEKPKPKPVDEDQPGVPPGKVRVTDSSTPEENLASIDATSPIVEKRSVRRFAFLLDRLGEQCRDRRSMLADYTVKAQEILDKQKGVKQSLREILEGVTRASSAGATKKCAELFALYISTAGEP